MQYFIHDIVCVKEKWLLLRHMVKGGYCCMCSMCIVHNTVASILHFQYFSLFQGKSNWKQFSHFLQAVKRFLQMVMELWCTPVWILMMTNHTQLHQLVPLPWHYQPSTPCSAHLSRQWTLPCCAMADLVLSSLFYLRVAHMLLVPYQLYLNNVLC